MFLRSAAFGTYHSTVRYLANDGVKANNQQLMLAGAVTGFIISFIEAPFDLVKTKVQTQIFEIKSAHLHVKPLSVAACAANVVRQGGFRALWQGWSATCIRNIPANAMFFPVNEMMKRQFASYNSTTVDHLEPWQRLVSGSAAGLCYWVGTYPLDAIKGQMQAAAFSDKLSWWATARTIYNTYG